ncbi:cyclin protein [Vairimorpha necatrix]|uniref:Cyclin protein n=1 Tax=Vairimorpha necatrix TaxID=6039 RepID=A0AAX4JAS0_9MICR
MTNIKRESNSDKSITDINDISNSDKSIDQRSELINLCNKYKLPLNVKNTCIKIYNKIHNILNIDDLIFHILAVAAKCEEIHTLNIPFRHLKHESQIHEALDFQYDFPSIYLKMSSILIKLQLNGMGDYTEKYEEACLLLDKLLIKDNDEYSDIEKVVCVLGLPENITGYLCNIERVKRLSKYL